jgi:multidrug efflux pump subunit AcrA (membrane-fusion protein)
MLLRKILGTLLPLAVVAGLGATAYLTREQWWPHVFPAKSGEADAAADEHAGHDHDAPEDRVKLTKQAQANLGLDRPGAVGTMTPQPYWKRLVIPGTVVDRPGESDRGVTTRTAGVITDIKARPGDTVRSGTPLFTLHLASEFVQNAQTELAKTAKDLLTASIRLAQTKRLVEAGTKPGIDLIDEQAIVNRLATQVQGHRRQLAVFGLSADQIARAEQGDAITQVEVTAPPPPLVGWFPFPGPESVYEVQDLRVQLGEQVQAGQTLCTLANHQRLFVEGRAFKSESVPLAVAAEQRLPIEAEFADEPPGAWEPAPPLQIHHLSNQVDPVARTFAFYLSLGNEARTFNLEGTTRYVWRFRPGQRVRLSVPVEKLGDSVFVLPAGAVVREGGEAFAFVKAGDLFIRKPVRVLAEDRNEVVIARDGSVSAAEYVVRTPAAAALNRAIKAAAGGEGGHEHSHEH